MLISILSIRDSCWIKLGYVGLTFVQPYFNHAAPMLGCADTHIEFPKVHNFQTCTWFEFSLSCLDFGASIPKQEKH
jgi:hypothetical protein